MRNVSVLATIGVGEDRQAALGKAQAVIEKLKLMRLKAAAKVEEASAETLRFYGFPHQHWRRIRTNNPLERIMREIHRRIRVVGTLLDGKSALMLAAARQRHIAGTQWGTKCYLRIDLLRDLDLSETHVA